MIVPDIVTNPYAWRTFAVDTNRLTLGSVSGMGGANRLPKDKDRLAAGMTIWHGNAMEHDDTPGGWAKGTFTDAVCNGSDAPPIKVQLAAIAAAEAEQPFDWYADIDPSNLQAHGQREVWVAAHTHNDGPDGAPVSGTPGPGCHANGTSGCGLYGTVSINHVLNGYLTVNAPVLALTQYGARTFTCDKGYRGAQCKIAAIMLLDDVLCQTLGKGVNHLLLEKIAAAYEVPAVVPHSTDPEAYVEAIANASILTDRELDMLSGQG